VTKLTPHGSVEIYPAPASQKVRVGLRYARQRELEDFLVDQVRATNAIAEAARKADIPCQQALPRDLGEWQSSVEFMLGPYLTGKDLERVSSLDFALAARRDADAFCRQGLGALLAGLAKDIAVQLSTPATAIDTRRGVAVETPKGTIAARAAIVTVSTNVISSGRLRFMPELPHLNIDTFGRLSLGSYDHIAIELDGNPLGLDSDDLVFEKSSDTHTAAMLANVSGTSLCLVEVAGAFGHDLSAKGEAVMVDFAGEWLTRLYGAAVKKAIRRASATRWNSDTWTLGAASAAVPGAESARRVLMEPLRDAVWFAGEAAHQTLWGTLGGAWESGERAADAVLRRLPSLKEPGPTEAEHAPARKPRRHAERRERPRGRRYGGGPDNGVPAIMSEEPR
jgi:monoamine oxidase